MTHVSDAVLAQMRDGVLAPRALLDADDHLAECEACRVRFAAIIAGESPHLGAEEIAALAAGAGSLEAQAHLSACRMCADEVRAMEPFVAQVDAYASGQRRVMSRVAVGVAAAIVVASGAWWVSRGARSDAGASVMAAVPSARDSAWMMDALRGVPLRGLSATDAKEVLRQVPADEHLLRGALAEQAGDRATAATEYRAYAAEHPGSAIAAQLVQRVTGRP